MNLLHEHQLSIKSNKSFLNTFVKIGVCSGGVFLGLLGYFYMLYGEPFLHQTYLYHFSRLDNRHSFSPIFYDIYLSFNSSSFLRSLAQLCVIFTVTRRVHSTLSPAYGVFLATYAFVSFNNK